MQRKPNLKILSTRELIYNATRREYYGCSDWYTPKYSNVKKFFQLCQRIYGRCIGRMYIGDDTHVGWVFERKVPYYGFNEKDTYLRQTWVECEWGVDYGV